MVWLKMRVVCDKLVSCNTWCLIKKRLYSSGMHSFLQNTMKTKNRAWSVQRTAFDKLRSHALLGPKYRGQVIFPSVDINFLKADSRNSDFSKWEMPIIFEHQDIMLIWNHVVKLHVTERVNFFKKLEPLCCQQLRNWNIKDLLLMMDIFYQGHYRAARFYREAFTMVDHGLDLLTVEAKDIVQFLFYASYYRSCPISLLRQFEDQIASHVDEFTCSDINLICHAFFTTNTSLQNYELIKNIANKALMGYQDGELNTENLSNVFKAMRHAGYEREAFYQQIAEVICRKDAGINTSVGSFGARISLWRMYISLGFIHSEFSFELLSQASSMLKTKKRLRFKDLVSLVWGSQVLQVVCPPRLLKVLGALLDTEHDTISLQYPQHMVEATLALVLAGHLPFIAISHVLSPGFMNLKQGQLLEQSYQLLLLDNVAADNWPEYQGHRLNKEHRSGLIANELCDIPKELVHRRGLARLLTGLQTALGGRDYIRCHNVLHYSKLPDLEMHFVGSQPQRLFSPDQVNREDSVSNEFREPRIMEELGNSKTDLIFHREEPLSLHLKPNSDKAESKTRLVVVKVFGWNQYAVNTTTLLGLHAFELKLLCRRGYEVITINPVKAAQLDLMNQEEMSHFIHQQIFKKLSLNCITHS